MAVTMSKNSNAEVKNHQKMSKRDQQLYCTWQDVESIWTFLKQSNALTNLRDEDWLTSDSEAALEQLFELAIASAANYTTQELEAAVHPDLLNGWIIKNLSREVWRTIKKSYARYKYNQKNRIFKIDLKDDTRLKLLAVKDELGFGSYDEVLQYQQQQIEELKQQLADATSKPAQVKKVATDSSQHVQVTLHDQQQLNKQATFVTDELITQHLLERLPNDYRNALNVVIKNLFCEGYLQAKSDKQRTVRKMQEHLETNAYLKQVGAD